MATDPGTKTERDELAPTEPADTEAQPTGPGPPSTTAETPVAGVIGRFRLEAPLGSGGMADVYRAHDPLLDRAVALKVLRTKGRADDPQRMRRVLREARAAAALTHPNTVTIFDVGEADGEVFIAMELLEGEVLRSVLGRGGITLDQKLQWLLQAARALAAAHERGLVHRDVKPDNMFVCADGALKLLDFGIAKRDEDDSHDAAPNSMGPSSLRTTEGRRVGTPRYMAPEQHASQNTDARTDEYAWGLVAFELLTGSHPGAVLAEVARPGTEGAALIGALRARVPELSVALASTIARALELRKEDRFPSMAPIVEALERKEERSPGPPGARRTRWWVAAVVGALALGGAAATRSVLRARSDARPSASGGGAAAAAAKALPPGCRVEPARSLSLAPVDRVAVLPGGELVTARDITRGLVLTRETPSGPVPFISNALMATAVSGAAKDYRDVALRGLRTENVSWVIAELEQARDKPSALVLGITAGGSFSMQAIPAFGLSGAVATPFGKYLLLAVTSTAVEGELSGAKIFTPGRNPRPTVVEGGGDAFAPAIATSKGRVAFAYLFRGERSAPGQSPELHLAMLDENAQRIGDVHAITPIPPMLVPAVAFAGETAAIYWIDNRGAKTRLTMSTFTQGEAAVSAPRVVVDEPAALQAPLTARLPSGEWVVAWLTSTGARPTLRVSPIGPGGELTGPTDVTTLPPFELLRATSGERGVELSWVENGADGAKTAKFVHVTCAR